MASFIVVLLAAAPAIASLNRDDVTFVQDSSVMFYRSDAVYTSTEGETLLGLADTGNNNQVSSAEAANYLAGLRAAAIDANATELLWDGLPPRWVALNVSATDLVGSVSRRTVTITYAGQLELNSAASLNHTFTIMRPFEVSNFSADLYLPSNWTIDSYTGISPTIAMTYLIAGWVTSAMAVITLHEPAPTPPPPPPPFVDNVAPVANAGQDLWAVAGQPLHFTARAADNDPDFPGGASFWWSFAYNGTPVNLSGLEADFAFWAVGQFDVTFNAMDAAGNIGTDTIRATIEAPSSQLPAVDAGDDVSVTVGVPVLFEARAAPNTTGFPDDSTFLWTFDYDGATRRLEERSFTFAFDAPGTFVVALEVGDGWGHTTNDTRTVTVLPPDVTAPVVNVGAPRTVEAGTTPRFEASATDDDPNFLEGATYWWMFTYQGTKFNISGAAFAFTFGLTGTYLLTFTALDAWGNAGSGTLEVTVISPDLQPPLVYPGPTYVTIAAGETLPLEGDATDNDAAFPEGATFWWTFNYSGQTQDLPGRRTSFTFNQPGSYSVTFWASDRWGNVGSAQRMVEVAAPPVAGQTGGGGLPSVSSLASFPFDALTGAVLAAVAGLGLAGIAVHRRRHRNGLLLSAAAGAAPAASKRHPYVVEGLLLLHRDGRLIQYQNSGTEAHFDSPEVMGSMFTAVTEFIRDSFGKPGALSRLTFGQNTLVLQRSKHFFAAAIVYGEPDTQLSETLLEVTRRLDSAYTGVVERWSGDRNQFEGIAGFLAPIFALTQGLTRADVRAAVEDRIVRLVSGNEHYKGYLRLRVAVANQTGATIKDARVTMLFNQNVLRLVRVEPAEFKPEGLTVKLGDIAAGDRVGVVYYLDPQTCSKTNIEGIATYFDLNDEEHAVKMKPRHAEIVCPLFFTPEQANPGTMRRLVENSLGARDSKLYRVMRLPKDLDYGELFNLAREAVQRRHVQLVRNNREKTPFVGKAWFYGETKHSKSPVIIRVTVSEERRTVEIFVAVESPATLTGLLAEFHRSLAELLQARAPALKLEPVLDDALKGLMAADEFGPESQNGQ